MTKSNDTPQNCLISNQSTVALKYEDSGDGPIAVISHDNHNHMRSNKIQLTKGCHIRIKNAKQVKPITITAHQYLQEQKPKKSKED